MSLAGTKRKAPESEHSTKNSLEAMALVPRRMSCVRPRFRNQRVLTSPGRHRLDDSSSVLIAHDFLDKEDLEQYTRDSMRVERLGGLRCLHKRSD